MNKEDLFDGFGNLDEDLLRRSEQGGRNMNKKRNKSKIIKIGSVAACLVVALGIGALFWNNSVTNEDKTSDNNDKVVAENSGDDTTIQEYINVSMLLASNEAIVDEALMYSNITVGEYTATYYKVASVESNVLAKSIGDVVEENQNWFRLSGHDDLFYLIFCDNNEYSLWRFGNFEEDSYPYSDVLQLIFDIDSVEDIKQIVVAPATMDNTEEGQAIQNEIGTVTIVDADNISKIYNVLSGLTCYGDDNWDMINIGNDTHSSMLEQVRAGRYLTFVTTDGMEIDTLKYTGISGMFYEFGGIAYNKLSKEQKEAIEQILNIDYSISEQQEVEQTVTDSEVDTEKQDVPIDESTYQEARDYSAEITDLQNRITQAMINNELPFVTSCGIYENPDRVMAIVNTEDEELLAKLRAFDTTGELLEIVYSSGSAVLE